VKKLGLVCVMLMLALTGCSKEKGVSLKAKGTIANPHVVATVGNEKIMDSDIDAILSQIPEPYRVRYSTPEAKREIVDRMAEVRMMAMEAKKRGIDQKPETKLKLEYITDQILAKDLEDAQVENVKITDTDIAKYYSDNKEKFTIGPRVKVRHILVDKEQDAKAILAQLKKGADFAKLAKEKSKCPSAPRGGELGWITHGRMDPDFEKAAFALKKGEMSGVVKSSFGYHIIQVEDKEDGKVRPLDEVKSSIERQMKREKRDAAVNKLKEEIKKQFPIQINEEYFKLAQAEAQKQKEKAKTEGMTQPGPGSVKPQSMPQPKAEEKKAQ